jgi:endoglucanase
MSGKTAMQYFTDEGITVGINIGNTLDAVDTYTNQNRPIAVETAWGNPAITQVYFNGLKSLGFNIIRVPVTWTGHIGPAPNYTISEARLKRVAEVVNMAKTAGLKVFINVHHDGNHSHGLGGWLNITEAPGNPAITAQFEALWRQVAEYFKNYGDYLMFQGFNEIHDGGWGSGTAAEYAIINDWNQKFTNAVRGTGGNNENRYLLYYGYNTSYRIGNEDYSLFKLPTDTATGRQIVGFHYYYPYPFSHDGLVHTWDTPTNRNHLENAFSAFKTNFTDKGIPVIIGENGPVRYRYDNTNANTATARDNRLAFIDFLYGKAKENGIVTFYWDTGGEPEYLTAEDDYGDFSLINRNNGQPNSTESRTVIERMIAAVK